MFGLILVLMAGAITASRVALVAATSLVVLALLFALDALQVRASVDEGMRGPFLFGVGKALFKHLTGAAAFFVAGFAARRIRQAVPQAAGRKGSGTLVVGW